MDSHSMNRKDFLKLTFTLIGGATVAAGCSSSSNGGSGGSSGTGGNTGTGGSSVDAKADTKVDTGPANTCADPLATMQLADSTGHVHMLVVPVSTLSATTDQTWITTPFPQNSGGHFHSVTLSVADLATLKGGGSVTKTSDMAGDPAHSHMYLVSCHGD